MTEESQREHALKAYTALVSSYMLGLIRLLEAQIAAYKTQVALSRLHQPDLTSGPMCAVPYADAD